MFGGSRFANHIWYAAKDLLESVSDAFSANLVDLFGLWTRPKKNVTHARQNNHYGVKNEKIPFPVAICEVLTRKLKAAISDEKGLGFYEKRDAEACCYGISSSWHGIVNPHPHIASAYAKNTTTTKFVNTRASSNA